jgi:hypothetical protein
MKTSTRVIAWIWITLGMYECFLSFLNVVFGKPLDNLFTFVFYLLLWGILRALAGFLLVFKYKQGWFLSISVGTLNVFLWLYMLVYALLHLQFPVWLYIYAIFLVFESVVLILLALDSPRKWSVDSSAMITDES